MAYFQGSQSALLHGLNPVIVEPSSKKKKELENPNNPIAIHGENFYIPENWKLGTKKMTGPSICLVHYTRNENGGGHLIHNTVVLKYLYFDVKTNRTFVFTKSGTKYYLAKSNAYFNPKYEVATDPYTLTYQLTKLIS